MCALLVALLVACAGSREETAGGPPESPIAGSQPDAAAPTSTPAPAAAHARRVGAPTPERPEAITLPDGTTVPVRAAATTSRGVLDVPVDIHQAGWWPGGSRLGDPFGSTLIAAHVDSTTQGLGPFASLLSARSGDRIRLRSEHLEQVFQIASLRLVPRRSFAGRTRLISPDGPRRLTLVTCASPYDASRGGYQNLAVLTATPVSGPHDRRGR